MPDKIVVLFVGNMGAGKDTAADILRAGIGGVKMAYADPLKDIVSTMLGIPRDILYGSQADKENFIVYGKTARHWLQWLGTQVGREMIHRDIWVHRFTDRVLASHATLICCSDCRFKNEIELFRERVTVDRVAGSIKVVTVRIINPRVPVNLEHQSESELYHLPRESFDVVLMNDGSIDDLRKKLKSFAVDYLGLKVDDTDNRQV